MQNIWTTPRTIPWVSLTVVPRLLLAEVLTASYKGLGTGLGLAAVAFMVGAL